MTIALKAWRVAAILVGVLAPVSAAIPAPQHSTASSMVTGAVTSQPIGHYEFCQRLPNECNIKSRSAPAAPMDETSWKIVREINQAVNVRYIPKTDLEAYFEAEQLPRHPLEAQGYLSIGCEPCTSKVLPGEDPRAGRWRGWDKVECGIHSPVSPIPVIDPEDPANLPAF